MATRTTGFFEQNHGHNAQKQQQQWRPRQRHNIPLGGISHNARPPMPPIPATSQTKSKLKAFAFAGGGPAKEDAQDTNEDRENDADDAGSEHDAATTSEHPDGAPAVAALEQPGEAPSVAEKAGSLATKTPQLPHANTFPSTPGMRIPLEELIGSFEESTKKAELPLKSPEERIGWIPNSSSTILTPNHKRKRARSSSPSCPTTSSQRQESLAFPAGTAALAEKRTPEADPSAALWKQYATDRQQSGDAQSKLPAVGQLVFDASPRALETPAKSAGFRRWASTGNDWPTSRTKKRRTATRTSISLWRDADVIESAGKSKVSALVDKIQESLATQRLASSTVKPDVQVSAPSSSSPLPDAGAMPPPNRPLAGSPLRAKQQGRSQAPAPIIQRVSPQPVSKITSGPNEVADNENHNAQSHQLGGDDFRPTKLHLQSKAPLPAYKRPSITRAPSHDSQKQVTPTVPTAATLQVPPVRAQENDDFGDDFDLSAEDLDELMDGQPPLHQRPLHQIPAHPDPPPVQAFDPALYERAASGAQAHAPILLDNDDDDEFGCDDIDEASLVQAELRATQAFRTSPRKRSARKARSPSKSQHSSLVQLSSPKRRARPLQRFVVKQVVEGEYTNGKGRRCPEKVLLAEAGKSHGSAAISLRDSWCNTSLAPGAVVHLASLPDVARQTKAQPPGQIVVSDAEESPLLSVHPDHMLSATTVADSFDCIRKAVLQDRIKATGETNKAMVYGKILHEIFQQALLANQWDDAYLTELVQNTVQNHVEDLWELGMVDTVLAVEEVRAKMKELAAWAKTFVAASPGNTSLVNDKKGEKVWMSVSKLVAVEEHIWSPLYGLKGNVDATVQTTLLDHPGEPVKKLIAPFEVKTGKTTQSPAHVAQTALYTLLMSDRYDVDVKAGILYYLESSAMMRVAPRLLEIRQMIQQRNRLAGYIHRARHPARDRMVDQQPAAPQTQEIEESGLPGMLRNPNKCGRCYAQASCFNYHALVENGNADSAGMIDDGRKNHSMTWHEAVGHLQLTTKDQEQARMLKEWFSKWDRLLTFEETDISRYRRELWTMDSQEREAVGRCFGRMTLAQDLTVSASPSNSASTDGIEGSGGKINRYTYRFVRSSTSKKHPLNEATQLTVGEPIVVSSEGGQWALANGYIVATSKRDITVAVDRRLGNARQRLPTFDAGNHQSLQGVMTVGYNEEQVNTEEQSMLYRLDKDEFSNGLALIRNSLVILMSSHPIHAKLRGHIVHGTDPRFASSSAPSPLRESQVTAMNEDQRAAITKVLAAQDYALVLGMPGTGKTTTIAQLIGALLAEGKSILLTSYTHTAVDNILLKIRTIAPAKSILRLGVPAKINPEVQKFCRLGSTSRGSIAEVDDAYMGSQIVAATCMGTNHALFHRRAFDVCIVDEASQITLPTSLGPLLHARKFVLVGDHYQLPPLVQDKAALEGGLDVSLFRQLSEQHPGAVAALGKQYRMCEEIMSLSNALIYDGQLRCGNDAVAQRTLDVKNIDALGRFHSDNTTSCATPLRHDSCWLHELCKPQRKVVFANTDAAGRTAVETLNAGKNITNQYEATLIAQLVMSLLAIGVPAQEIGVITLYRSQLALLRQLFKTAGITSEVEIDSADRFQGRDKECIVLSMVRSNEAGIVGDLLKDWRRVNVALTRAKSKLIVLGSRQTLQNNDLLDNFLRLVYERRWSLELPVNADARHNFLFSSQALSSLRTPDTAARPAHSKRPSSERPAVQPSPTRAANVLRESQSAGNRTILKEPGKLVKGRPSQRTSGAKEQAAIQIYEDLTGDF